MSGGSLDYICFKVEEAASSIRGRNISILHNAFANHLFDVAKALHDIEWVLSSDMSKGDDTQSIKKVINPKKHLEEVIKEAKQISAELQTLLLRI